MALPISHSKPHFIQHFFLYNFLHCVIFKCYNITHNIIITILYYQSFSLLFILAEEDSAKDNNCPTMTGQKETQSQYELKNFTSGSLESKIGIITGNSHESLNYPQEEKDEESDVVDYDEFAPLLPLYNTA